LWLASADLTQSQCGIRPLGSVNVDHISGRRHNHARRSSCRAEGLGAPYFDLDDVIDPILPRALEYLAHNAVDGKHSILSRRRGSILCIGGPKTAQERSRDENPCRPNSGRQHDLLLVRQRRSDRAESVMPEMRRHHDKVLEALFTSE
jgi:hypothetical protein